MYTFPYTWDPVAIVFVLLGPFVLEGLGLGLMLTPLSVVFFSVVGISFGGRDLSFHGQALGNRGDRVAKVRVKLRVR